LSSDKLNLPSRSPIAHKGDYGNVLVLGGWGGMEGAGFLAGIAALRVGAGKVYICGPETVRQPFELINVPKEINEFKSVVLTMDAIVVGPGLGQHADEFIETAWAANVPLVMDADGLRWLARTNLKTQKKGFWVGTPHPGEASALLTAKLDDRFIILNALHQKFGGRWVLKGPGTLIGPKPIFINSFANSALATAGSGDVLAGIIGGLIAQKTADPELLGVYLHTEAARQVLVDNKKTLLASDILNKIGNALTAFNQRQRPDCLIQTII
jgi:NAD(P)H-hydrate epimerase